MRDTTFRFKQFSCKHGQSSMKIGVDAVLLGAWANVDGKRILDVGTGCGVIALMCAQRNEKAKILSIDIDAPSVAEANENFEASPWGDRLEVENINFIDLIDRQFDLIISNPPYFDAGVSNLESPRLKARHKDQLSPESLLLHGSKLLAVKGRIAMIVPADQLDRLMEISLSADLFLRRGCRVRGHRGVEVKRVLLEFQKGTIPSTPYLDELTLEETPGEPTQQYLDLCRDFYLKF